MKLVLAIFTILLSTTAAAEKPERIECPKGINFKERRNPPPCDETREQWLRVKKHRDPAKIGFYVMLLVADLERCKQKYADVGETRESLCRFQWEYWKKDRQNREERRNKNK